MIYKKVYGFAVPDGEPSTFDLYLLFSSPLSLLSPLLSLSLFSLSFYHLTTLRYDRGREKERTREERGEAHAPLRAEIKGHLVRYPYRFLTSELVCEERGERERERGERVERGERGRVRGERGEGRGERVRG